MFILTAKRALYFRRWRLDETAATVFLSNDGGGRPQSFTQAAPNELKLGKGVGSGESWPSAGGRVGG